jgi:hypothetical protein
MTATKINKIYRLLNCFLVIALVVATLSCNTNSDKKNIQTTADSLQASTATNLDNSLSDINLADTIKNLLTISLPKDTFEYEAFYNESSPYLLLYFKTGNIFTSKNKHALTLYSINDTTVRCELNYLTDGKWTNAGSNIFMHIDGFSPAYFNVRFDDYNFDGNKDLNIIFYNSMGVVYSYGYILTFNESSNSLTLHPETIEIPTIEIDKKRKMITSTEYSNPNHTSEEYKIVSSFRWTNDTLKLISEKKYKLK